MGCVTGGSLAGSRPHGSPPWAPRPTHDTRGHHPPRGAPERASRVTPGGGSSGRPFRSGKGQRAPSTNAGPQTKGLQRPLHRQERRRALGGSSREPRRGRRAEREAPREPGGRSPEPTLPRPSPKERPGPLGTDAIYRARTLSVGHDSAGDRARLRGIGGTGRAGHRSRLQYRSLQDSSPLR